jgi:predicted GNAT superfamily acetyltransferase
MLRPTARFPASLSLRLVMNEPRHTATTTDVGPDTSEAEHGVAIRPLTSLSDLRACVALQNAVWGPAFSEAVSVSLLKVATQLGGVAIGAFTPDGALAGFVFGLTGLEDGRTVHWSHLLGVLSAARNLGVGRMLKEEQRAELARRGIDEMRWSFDPLVAKNAHLNLNLLGARVVRYAPDMYGTTISALHHGLATDRLVVSCRTTCTGGDSGAAVPSLALEAPMLSLEPRAGDRLVEVNGPMARWIRLEIPSDFHQLVERSPDRAAEWHASAREHFLWSLRRGYTITGFHRDAITSRAFYVLTGATTADASRGTIA